MAAISGRGKGGAARAKALSAAKRRAIAKKAAVARWEQAKPQNASVKAHGNPPVGPKKSARSKNVSRIEEREPSPRLS